MADIVVIGGTGYAGGHIVTEALGRDHRVTVVARKEPAAMTAGADYVTGDITDLDQALIDGADAVVVAISPRGDMAGRTRSAIAGLADKLAGKARLAVVGGAGGSLVSPGGPRVVDTPDFPEPFKPEAQEMAGVLTDLRDTPEALDWFLIHPAAGFIADNPGERTGTYRAGGEVLVVDADGNSFISGADLAVAVLDELERPAHRRQNFTVGY